MLIPEKTKTPRRRFFRKRPHRIRSIAMLPSMITLINGICGFIAIGLAAKGPDYYALAGTMIFYAMIADTLDGRVARISKTTSSFGGQLDSMCDEISFGAAPAFLMLSLLLVVPRFGWHASMSRTKRTRRLICRFPVCHRLPRPQWWHHW
ncbi:MAG: CDP-alcohol phosphatidyltransferase family protein [Planctomycetota bacterium]|jgi:CDP-diacylglycerol--serine O-phosphatidyltransferase